MSYQGLAENLYEAREKEHQEYHINEHFFDKNCEWCKVEMCIQCQGTGMDKACNLICGRCGGIGRII